MMPSLYAGTILTINLSTGEISRTPTAPYTGCFLGGRGINIKLFYDHIHPGSDPLSPENVLVFGVGPFGASGISGSRTEVTAKSPETKLLGSTNFGGFFASELKFAGYDHIIVSGKSKEPVYLWIDNELVEIRDASSMWGADTYEAPALIRSEIGQPDAKIVCIGPAGENLVRFASVQHEMGHGGGRTGLGTVMGSKNLKAIAVHGTKGLRLANSAIFLDLASQVKNLAESDPRNKLLSQSGVTPGLDDQNEFWLGISVTDVPNGVDPRTNPPKTQAIPQKFSHKRAGCYGCPVQCMEHYLEDEVTKGVISCELYSVFVQQVRCHDSAASLQGAILCQRYGLDAVSTGGMITWLMHLYEKGIITDKDTDGIPMEWGNGQSMIKIIEKIAHREGIGDILAEGIVRASAEIGRGSEAYVYEVKKMIVFDHMHPGWSPYVKAACLAAAVGPRGDNIRSLSSWSAVSPHSSLREAIEEVAGTKVDSEPNSYEGKPELVIAAEDLITIADMLSTCKWQVGIYTPHLLAQLFSAGSGIPTSVEDLFNYARRIRTMERAYEACEGLTSEQDTLPKSFFNNPIKRGIWKGGVLKPDQFEEMKRRYYRLRGWDPNTGIPTEETLKQMGLQDIAEDLRAHGKLPERDHRK